MAYIPEFDNSKNKESKKKSYKKKKSPYNNEWWRKYSFKFRTKHIYCQSCLENGILELSKVTDHIVPISKGGSFRDEKNHMALCDKCHNVKRQKESNGIICEYVENVKGELIPK
jgi:5-methylcytosine-specific restriction endonuclease McrA